jgi:hypothetical protein
MRSDLKGSRQILAGQWLSNPVRSREAFATHEEECLRTFRQAIIDELAVSNKTEVSAAGVSAATNERLHEAGYVSRPELESEFEALVREGAKVIVLWGFPGMGKTSLARDLAISSKGIRGPEIRVHRHKIVTRTLRAALAMHGITVEGVIADHEDEFLAELTCGGQHPEFVLLDNLETTDDLAHILPPTTRSILVVTSRAKGKLPLGRRSLREEPRCIALQQQC